MATENERAPSPTEVSLPETEQTVGTASGLEQHEATGDARLPIGYLLGGRHRIERELCEGGMGVVYLARDEQIAGEVFAIKVLKEDLHPESLALLREEVRKTRKLSHPNIVDVHSVNFDGKRLYVLMEYLEGKSLDALLNEDFGRGMPFSHAWPIIEDVAAALGNAHDHNVIHSDLKPANVFVTTSGRTKLLDFGIARVSRGPLLNVRTGPRALTPAYASCEMLEGKEADPRDDIYSFGCVIYEMLSGKRAFGGLTALEARGSGARMQPLAVLTQGQNAALAQALAFNRGGRTSSVEQLIGSLAADHRPRRYPIAVLGAASIAALAVAFLTYLVLDKLSASRHSLVVQSAATKAEPATAPAAPTPVFNPPPHSIAVLPFVNMSGDKQQEYFSDGLTEELLNSLSRINELQVAARTSSFYFKGEHADLSAIARKLNVAAVLEGSVRRSGHTVRITAQLNNAVTGFHVWSQSYDRDLGDVLQLQTEIATTVAEALKVTLLNDVSERIELGGTRNPAAFDAYLRGVTAFRSNANEGKDAADAIAAFTAAIRLDPHYALAVAARSVAHTDYSDAHLTGAALQEGFAKAEADARRANQLAPDLAQAHWALAQFLQTVPLDFVQARAEYEHAAALAPGNAQVLRSSATFTALTGHIDTAIANARRAVALDPLARSSYTTLGVVLYAARRYAEAATAYTEAIKLNPDFSESYSRRGRALYWLGDLQGARTACEAKRDTWDNQGCLAVVYDKLGRHADAEAELAKMKAAMGDTLAYQYATIYAQWGDRTKALGWLDTAMRLRDSGLVHLKTDPLLDSLRKEPRFRAIERALKFPD